MRKIDIYTKGNGILNQWQYECSTSASRTCKDAKARFCIKYSLDTSQVKACFSK